LEFKLEVEALEMIPDSPRVFFEVNLLEHVSCNVHFPPILTIIPQPPAAFHERIRDKFPFYKLAAEFKFNATIQPGAQFPMFTSHNLPSPGTATHLFESENQEWSVKLATDNLIVSCKKYERWESFLEWLHPVIDAFWDVYRPSFFQHCCLRYKNSVRRSLIEVEADKPWASLIQPWVGGALVRSEVEGVVEMLHRFVVQLPEKQGRIETTCSLGTYHPTKESAFLIESHVYNDENKRRPDVFPHLHTLNRWASRFFRWCITEELHQLLRPRPVPATVESGGDIPLG
jgi:uncharacterized protein (TIGR04255 family)